MISAKEWKIVTVPTKNSELENDSEFITLTDIPEQASSEFQMEDATDAELNVVGVPESGLLFTTSYSAGTVPAEGRVGFCNNNGTGYGLCTEDLNGTVITAEALNGYEFLITVEGYAPVTAIITATDNDGYIYMEYSGSIILTSNESLSIVPTTIDKIPLLEGDAWVRNDSGKFVPTQVALKSDLDEIGTEIKAVTTPYILLDEDSDKWLVFDTLVHAVVMLDDSLPIGHSFMVSNVGGGYLSAEPSGNSIVRGAKSITDIDSMISFTKITADKWQSSERGAGGPDWVA